MPRRALTSIAVVSLLALTPTAALADGGAGDNQYQDPLVAPPPAKKKTTTTTTTTPAPAPTPAAASAPAATTPAAAPTATPTAASATQLPRTGSPADLIGLGGATMLLAGLVLRRRTVPQ